MLVRYEKYGEAARIKAMADELERRERARIDEDRLVTFSQREAKFRAHQRAELEALLGRFNGRRDEHVKARDADVRRLLQRNKNVLAIIDARHAAEEREASAAIRASLMAPLSSMRRAPINAGQARRDAPSPAAAAAAAERRAAAVAGGATNLFASPKRAGGPARR